MEALMINKCPREVRFGLARPLTLAKRIAIVGHFPFIPKLRESAKQLWVIEKKPHEGDSPEDMASDLIHGGTVTQITSRKL